MSEAADVRLESFGLSRGLSAAADGSTLLTALSLSKWSAFPEGAIASILRDASAGQHRAVLSPFLLHPRQHRDGGEDNDSERHPGDAVRACLIHEKAEERRQDDDAEKGRGIAEPDG